MTKTFKLRKLKKIDHVWKYSVPWKFKSSKFFFSIQIETRKIYQLHQISFLNNVSKKGDVAEFFGRTRISDFNEFLPKIHLRFFSIPTQNGAY